jgi:thiol-disulfide isomerase/thioredoxin
MRFAVCLFLASLVGCGDGGAPDQGVASDLSVPAIDLSASAPDLSEGPDLSATPPVDLAGPPACRPPLFYPPPPYGFRAGRVIEDLSFQGQHDTNADGKITSADTVSTISLHDYFQNSNIQVLVIVALAEWCGPCKMEAPGLKTLYQQYQSAGGHVAFLDAVLQNTSSLPATIANVDQWGNAYSVPYDMVQDGANQLGPYFVQQAFPMQMVIRTSDMQIWWQNAGADVTELQAQIDAALATGPMIPDGGGAGMACDLGGTGSIDASTLAACDPCTSDAECPPNYVCATDALGGRFCTRTCAVDTDCPQNAPGDSPIETCVSDPGGKGLVCRPVGGACHGAGVTCDWCRPSQPGDCAGDAGCFAVQFTGERFCSQQCTVDYDYVGTVFVPSNDSCPPGSYCSNDHSGCGFTGTCTVRGVCTGDPNRAQATCHP